MTQLSSETSSYEKLVDNLNVPGEGARENLHGTDFHIKVLMHTLWMAQKSGYDRFRLATEFPDAGKLDDVVFQYRINDRWKIRAIQIKHKEGNNLEAVDKANLFSRNSSKEFAIFKYFKSVISIEERCKMDSIYLPFRNAELEDACLITNADLPSHDARNSLSDVLRKVEDNLKNDKLLRVSDADGVVCYTINAESESAKKLISIFNETSDFYKLVEFLALDIISEQKVNKSASLLREFLHALKKEVFVSERVRNGFVLKFTEKFLKGNQIQEATKSFRTALMEKIGSQTMLENIRLSVSEKIALEFQTNELVTLQEPEYFAKELCSKFKASEKCIDIPRSPNQNVNTNGERTAFETNLHILRQRNVIIEMFSKLRFSSSFIEKDKLDDDLQQFRQKLMENLQKHANLKINELHDLTNYTWKISIENFHCWNEEALLKSLPRPYNQNDYDNFFSKFKLIVNYPNRFGISDLLEKGMREQFCSLNIEVFSAFYQVKMFNWMSERFGTFYTSEKVEQLFDTLMQSLNCWQIEGLNQSYFAAIPKTYIFKTNEQLLSRFLDVNKKDIVCLAFEYLILGRIRIFQALKTLSSLTDPEYQKYTYMFGHIFLFASKLMDTEFRKQVSKALEEAILWNLLVIDCDIEDNSLVLKWVQEMQELNVKRNSNRKFILLTDNQFKQNIYQNIHYITTSFTDLSEISQEKFLQEKSVYLQGSKVATKTIFDTHHLNLIDAETLVKFIKEEKVQIGRKLHFSLTYDPLNYVDRSLEKQDAKICVITEDSIVREPFKFALSSIVGMGKSTLISSLSSKIQKNNPNIWVIRINLNDYLSFFDKMMKNIFLNRKNLQENHDNSTTDFLIELLNSNKNSKLDTNFEIELLKAALSNTISQKSFKLRIALLVDGFDEISPYYNTICLDWLQGIQKCRLFSFVITTRPYCKGDLEKLHLDTSFKLCGLTYEQKYLYVKKLILNQTFNLENQNYFSLKYDFYFNDLRIPTVFSYPEGLNLSILKGNFPHTMNNITIYVEDCTDWTTSESHFDEECCRSLTRINTVCVLLTGFDDFGCKYQERFFTNAEKLDLKSKIWIFTSNKDFVEKSQNSFLLVEIPIPKVEKIHDNGMNSITELNTFQLLHPFISDMHLHDVVLSKLKFTCKTKNEFHSTPLFCQIMSKLFAEPKSNTEVSRGSLRKFLNMSSTQLSSDDDQFNYDRINDLELYSRYIEEIHSIYWHDKMQQNPLNVAANREKIESLKKFIERHQKLAIYDLFYSREKCLKLLLSQFDMYERVIEEIQELLKQIESGEEKGGLVKSIEDGRPVFLHRSFAEYLVADFKSDVLSSNRASLDFYKICTNCSHADSELDRVFSPAICDIFQKLLDNKAGKISNNIYNQCVILQKKHGSEWKTAGQTFLVLLASYPQLFMHFFNLLKSKGIYTQTKEMFMEFFEDYVDVPVIITSDWKSFEIVNEHAFFLNRFKAVRKTLKDGSVMEDDENLENNMRIANIGTRIDSKVMKDHRDRLIYDICPFITGELLPPKFFQGSTQIRLKWTNKVFRAAYYAWSLAIFHDHSVIFNETLLHIASKLGLRVLLKWLLEQGYPINLGNTKGETPLHDLRPACIEWLVEEKVLDSRCRPNTAYLEALKNAPRQCPEHLKPNSNECLLEEETFDLVLGHAFVLDDKLEFDKRLAVGIDSLQSTVIKNFEKNRKRRILFDYIIEVIYFEDKDEYWNNETGGDDMVRLCF